MAKFFARIRSILSWPIRVLFFCLGVPNCRIVYKSGHIEYHFFNTFNMNHNGDEITSANWETLDGTKIMHIGLNNIESITWLY